METNATVAVTLEQFRKLLQNHDWFYHYSDYSPSYKAGAQSEAHLKELCATNAVFAEEYRAYSAYVFRSHSRETDWRLCKRPEWAGEDTSLVLWELLQDPEVIATLKAVESFVSNVKGWTEQWKTKGPVWVLKRPEGFTEPLIAIPDSVAKGFTRCRDQLESILNRLPSADHLSLFLNIAQQLYLVHLTVNYYTRGCTHFSISAWPHVFYMVCNYGGGKK